MYLYSVNFTDCIVPGDISEFSIIHEVDLDLPEECLMILQATLLDIGWGVNSAFKKLTEYTMTNPGDEMLAKAYEFYKNALKCIYYKGNPELISLYRLRTKITYKDLFWCFGLIAGEP